MQVRLKIGRRAGEVAEVAHDAARAMIADGRATDMRAEVNAAWAAAQPEVKLPRAMAHVQPNRRKGNR
jgi:hypothetical protein